jgi:DNA-binding beta-propeller fold protein YncE
MSFLSAAPAAACLLVLAPCLRAVDYRGPAGDRAAQKRAEGTSILPGGRLLAPQGAQYVTGPGPFGLAVSSGGRRVATANSGPDRFSVSLLDKPKDRFRTVRHFVAERRPRGEPAGEDSEWRSVFMGLAFADDRTLYASDGNAGQVRVLDPDSGQTRRVLPLNGEFGGVSYGDSYSGDLALDAERGRLYVVDQANFRAVALDVRSGRVVSSVRLGRLPFALALSPDKRKLYVTNIGMFEYQAIEGADRQRARETGLPFAAFGFPSPESVSGVFAETGGGRRVRVPGLGDPNVRESNSLAIVDLSGEQMKLEGFVRTGLAFGQDGAVGGSSPSGVVVTERHVFVSNGHNDTISVLDRASAKLVKEVPIRIPGLEKLRGVLPIGMAFHAASGWLLIAEAGINAVGVLDTRKMEVIGHIPAGWFPSRVAIDGDDVYVTNVRGNGTGPNIRPPDEDSFVGVIRRGSISVYPLPGAEELPKLTATALGAAGFTPLREEPAPLPEQIRHVVIIVKENRTFDEVFGDLREAANGRVRGFAGLARFGARGFARGRGERFSLQDLNVMPNHRKLAELYAFSDNFYADSEVSVDGHHWVVGAYPNAWTETTYRAAYAGQKDFRLPTAAPGRLLYAGSNSSVHPEEQPEAGTIWHHLERHGISFRNFGEGFELAGIDEGVGLKPTGARFLTNVPMPDPLFRNTSRRYPGYNTNIPDQYRATQFIAEIEELYRVPGKPLPRLLFVHLPNDHIAKARPEDGYPYEESFVADNDYALGRMVEYLSRSPWWRQLAIFITEDDAQGGRDHIDSHRTVLQVVSPWAKKNYVSRVNTSFPGLLKTVFRILGLPPLNLFDATASDLSDCFTDEPDFAPYTVQPIDPRLFVPEKAREPMDPKPSPRMDDPAVLREQHRRQ